MTQSTIDNEFAKGEDPDIVAASGPEPELGAPGGDDSTVGTSPEGQVSETDDQTDETGEFGPGVDRDTGADVGDTGSPSVGG